MPPLFIFTRKHQPPPPHTHTPTQAPAHPSGRDCDTWSRNHRARRGAAAARLTRGVQGKLCFAALRWVWHTAATAEGRCKETLLWHANQLNTRFHHTLSAGQPGAGDRAAVPL